MRTVKTMHFLRTVKTMLRAMRTVKTTEFRRTGAHLGGHRLEPNMVFQKIFMHRIRKREVQGAHGRSVGKKQAVGMFSRKEILSNWLAAVWKALPLTKPHHSVSNDWSNTDSAGVSHAERVGGLGIILEKGVCRLLHQPGCLG